ncbi:effector-binding domain-containing protein [Devosia sp. UYZn731]|uniref:GyrI-like domain-containing protein n=1 Tax=Devosia sp. UYZn731 TaxID=3156345 RepID=UPI003391DB9F
MEIIAAPALGFRQAYPTLGIRVHAPFRGMLSVRDQLWAELIDWLKANNVPYTGRLFLRFHVVNMTGTMDMEAGVITSERLGGDDRIKPGELPAGDYVTLTHRDHSVRANKLLLQWAADNQIELDKTTGESGDHFACRYERVSSDIRTERRRTNWLVELNIRALTR